MDLPKVAWAKRFVLIASTPRSGSHYLGHMLAATGECGVPLEYLHRASAKYWAKRFGPEDLRELFPRFVEHRTSANGTFCMKAHWRQFKPFLGSVDEMTRGLGIEKTLWALRRDLLAQAVSGVVASQTGVWISGANPTSEPKYDYSAIVKFAKLIRNSNVEWKAYLEGLPDQNKLTLVYEDLLQNPEIRNEISSFLGLNDRLTTPSRTRKQSGDLNNEWKQRFRHMVAAEDQWILEPQDAHLGLFSGQGAQRSPTVQ